MAETGVRTAEPTGFEPDYRLVPCAGPDCREVFEPTQPHHRHCSDRCRKRAWRVRKNREIEETVLAAVRRALRDHHEES